MDNTRRAALAVHALAPGDRAWLLGQLADQERTRLDAMLGELATLGIPASVAMLDVAEPDGPVQRLRRADPRRVAAVLAGERDEVIASCLALETWAWRGFVLDRLSRGRREQVRAAMARRSEAPVTPTVRDALLSAFDARVAHAPSAPRLAGVLASWQALRGRLARRRRA